MAIEEKAGISASTPCGFNVQCGPKSFSHKHFLAITILSHMIGLGGVIDPSNLPTLVLVDEVEPIEKDVPEAMVVVEESPQKTPPVEEPVPPIESGAAEKAEAYSAQAPLNAS